MNLDDPRLTAYALNELDEFEREEIEALIKDDAGARQEVARIRRAGATLAEKLEAEAYPRLSPEQREAIEERATPERPFPWTQFLGWGIGIGVTAIIAALFLPALNMARQKSRLLTVANRHEVVLLPAENAPADESTVLATPLPQLQEKNRAELKTEGGKQIDSLSTPSTAKSYGIESGGSIVANNFDVDTATVPQLADGSFATGSHKDTGGNVLFNDGHVQFQTRMSTSSLQGLPEPPDSPAIRRVPFRRDAQTTRSVSGNDTSDERELGPVTPGTESYSFVRENTFVSASVQPLSTFGLDVDTASYANVRRFLSQGQLPPRDAVRIEEMLNYFSYDYPRPRGNEPFALYVEMAECPWNPAHRLALVGLKAKDVAPRKMQPMNLVFLLDVSGSMADPNKLPLVKQGMRLLVEQLTARDRVAIVVYASNAKVVLPSTRGDDHETILEAIDSLEANGSTNGGEGIQWAYRQATANFIEGGVNRVILCTDGDFNVGITDQRDLVHLIEQQARSGVFLSVFGFGMGNLKDSTMQKLADKGNGHYAYIDDLDEARKMFVDQMRSTLVTVAKDAKLQVEFNPALVDSYRLIGYEKRMLRPQDFNNDRKDAGDIGAGHTVTALYEIVPAGAAPEPGIDPLKYQPNPHRSTGAELMTVKLRYKEPDAGKSQLLTAAVKDTQTSWRGTSDDFRFAAAVACFGMTLRDSGYRASATFDLASELAGNARGRDDKGYRTEFIEMVRRARELTRRDP